MTRRAWGGAVLALALFAAGCGSSPDPDPSPGPDPTPGPASAAPPGSLSPPPGEPGETVTVALADRPFQLHLPESAPAGEPLPLVVTLHGYTSSAAEQESYFGLTAESDRRGFLYAMPDGTLDPDGDRFWNAGTACCDFHDTGVDDVAYLRELIETVAGSYPVDPARVYLVGHSNGGFMAHRLACEHADLLTAIVSLAGAAPADPSTCEPERAVSVLQIHGTADRVIRYEGGDIFGRSYPSVAETAALWRERNGCADEQASGEPLDLAADLAGEETSVTAYPAECRDEARVEVWTIAEGGHVPSFTDRFAPAVLDFLYARAAS